MVEHAKKDEELAWKLNVAQELHPVWRERDQITSDEKLAAKLQQEEQETRERRNFEAIRDQIALNKQVAKELEEEELKKQQRHQERQSTADEELAKKLHDEEANKILDEKKKVEKR